MKNIKKFRKTVRYRSKTSGLLGEQYIALTMGFDDGETAMLKNGSQIQDTKSAMVLEI